MTIARAVLTNSGAILIPEGCLLTDAHLVRLRQAGVQTVWIKNETAADETAQQGDSAEIARALEQRFEKTAMNQTMLYFKQEIKRYLAMKGAKRNG